jgi:predicted small metal-binding protein
MAKEMRCADLGMECGFVARGETDDDVVQQAAEHGKQTHGMSDEDLQRIEPDIRGAIHEAA